MAKHILTCCGKYTMKEICSCEKKTYSKIPPKYSPEDKYAKYRRKVKKPQLLKKGLLGDI